MDDRSETPRHARALGSFACAIWGACLGLYLTALILLPQLSRAASQEQESQANLSWLTGFQPPPPWQVGVQKRMYFVYGLCCPLLAWLSLRWRSRLNGWACLLSFALFIPLISKVFKGVFQAEPHLVDFLAAGLVLGVPLINWGRLFGFRPGTIEALPTAAEVGANDSQNAEAQPMPQTPRTRAYWTGLVLLIGLLVVFLLPRRVGSFADALAGEAHLASYFIGPALSLLDPDKVPGLDFESHYGVGHAYAYSFFLGANYHKALCGYVWFAFAVLSFYFVSAYVVMNGWLRSPRGAFLAALLLLALSMESLSYRWPSCWPIRFPFLFVFLGVAGREKMFGKDWPAVLLAGACAGLSFFWQTDNGLVMAAAGASYYAALSVREKTKWLRAPLFLVGAATATAGLNLLAFGPRTLSAAYYQGLLAPIFEYSSGFGWWLMRWHFGWTYLYNLIGPLVALATLGWCVFRFGRQGEAEKRDARFLFLASAVGMLMLFKWVNRAQDLAWTMNAAAIVIVLFWWVRCAVLAAAAALEERAGVGPRWLGGLRWQTALGITCFVGLLGLGFVVGRLQPASGITAYSTSPIERLPCFTLETPTPANWLLSQFTEVKTLPAVGPLVDETDVTFLRQHTSAGEPVTLLAPLDWVFLAEAHRSAAFHWVPVYYTHTHANVERVVQDLKDSPCVFVQRDSLDILKKIQPNLHERLVPVLDQEFTLVDSGNALDRYVRRDGRTVVNRHAANAW